MDAADKERKILIAVDEGEESSYALSWCVNNILNQNSKDTLILLYVKPPRVLYTSLDGIGEDKTPFPGYLFSNDIVASVEKYNNEVAEVVMEKAKRICKDLNHVKVETRVEHGDPRDIICQSAEKLNVDLVVMGSHGYGLFKRAFLGSVSNHCSQNVKCPILIVKKTKSNGGN